MDDFTAAVTFIVGSFALLLGWKKFQRSRLPESRPPVPTMRAVPAVDEATMQHVREACQIHKRWSVANNTHVACFNLFTILETDEASFRKDADAFAAVVGPSMQDQSLYVPPSYPAALSADRLVTRSGEEKTRMMMRAWEYLNDAGKYDSYTTVLTPLIAEQKQALGLDCAAQPLGGAQPPGPGSMSEICGW